MKKMLIFTILVIPVLVLAQNLLNNPESIAYDSEYDRYLVSNYGDGKIIAIDSEGVHSEFFSGLGGCLGNYLYNGVLYVSVQEYTQVSSGNAVVGIDINDQQMVMELEFEANNTMDGMAVDNEGMIYVIDTNGKLFQIDPVSETYEMVVPAGMGLFPQDCYFDEENNRLVVVNFNGGNSFIRAIDLEDYSISVLLNPPFGNFDGVTMDQYGNIYVASFDGGGSIYKIDDSFEYEPELISTGHNGPAGLDFNREDNILAVPNFYSHIADFISVEFEIVAEFSGSVIYGNAPLNVQFYDESLGSPIVWWWDFDNDGSTDSFEQNPIWTFTENGIYTVRLKVHNGEFEDIEIKTGYVVVEETPVVEEIVKPAMVLEQNYPNPFNPTTTFGFNLAEHDINQAFLEIYNTKGQKINQYSISNFQYSITWDGTDTTNQPVPSGMYIYQLKAGEQVLDSKKCLLLK